MINSNSNQRHQHHHHHYWVAIALSLLLSTILFVILRSTASAATINVVAGTDAINDNDQCQLSEAIQNINDQAQTNNDCPAGDGSNDTINLPAGTITLTTILPELEQSVTIQGQGMGETTINASGSSASAIRSIAGTLRVYDLIITQFSNRSISAQGLSSLIVERVEIKNGSSDNVGGIELSDPPENNSPERSLVVKDVYIHDLSSSDGVAIGIGVGSPNGTTTTAIIEDVTIKSLSGNGLNAITHGITISTFWGVVPSAGTINVSLSNISINNITSISDAATGISALATTASGNSLVDINASNISVSDINGVSSQAWGGESGATIVAAGASMQAGDVAAVNINIKNALLSTDILLSCFAYDVTPLFGGQGTVNNSITSLGGNISDDESCNDYFTESTDQNNITNLADYIGDIADNGGSVPTMALLPGNPAIDGGVCGEGVPSTDARGITRPQGTTCDSGAFEVEQAASTGTVAGDTAVALNVPTGVVVNEFSTVSGSIPADNQGDAEYEFPLGLLSFELGVVEGSANEISLDFESDLDPESVVARKYNPSDQTYTTLENAVVTKITKDNQPTLRLTYTITDGTFPDLDNQANGTIIDPIGLATEKQGVLANTGDLIILAIPIGLSLLLGAFIVTYIDYRKHKKPLQEADQELAKTYTYWHHLKTVTIPLFSYRLSFGFERRERVAA